jgi:hypothetical protein
MIIISVYVEMLATMVLALSDVTMSMEMHEAMYEQQHAVVG